MEIENNVALLDEEENESEETEPEEEVEPEESETEDEPSHDDKEYEAELERLEKGRPDPEKARERFKKSHEQGEDGNEDIDARLNRMLDERLSGMQKTMLRGQVEQMVRAKTNSDAEYRLAMRHYDQTINPTGDITEDVDIAVTLANRHRLRQENAEAKRALASKQQRTTHQVQSKKPTTDVKAEPKISAEERKLLNGFTWNPNKARWEGRTRAIKRTRDGKYVTELL